MSIFLEMVITTTCLQIKHFSLVKMLKTVLTEEEYQFKDYKSNFKDNGIIEQQVEVHVCADSMHAVNVLCAINVALKNASVLFKIQVDRMELY